MGFVSLSVLSWPFGGYSAARCNASYEGYVDMVIFAGVLFAADIPSRSQVLHRFEFCFGRFFQLYSRMIERFQFTCFVELLFYCVALS